MELNRMEPSRMDTQSGMTSTENIVKNLHPLEVKTILRYKETDELFVEKLESDLDFKAGNGNQALSWLLAKQILCEKRRETAIFYELTGLGRDFKENGTPVERILGLVSKKCDLSLPEIAKELGIDNKETGSAFGILSKLGLLAMNEQKQVHISVDPGTLKDGKPISGDAAAYFSTTRGLLEKAAATEGGIIADAALNEPEKKVIAAIAKKRGAADAAFRIIEKETPIFTFTKIHGELAAALKTSGISGDEIGTLTAEKYPNSRIGKTFVAQNERKLANVVTAAKKIGLRTIFIKSITNSACSARLIVEKSFFDNSI
ncbi:MAG: hypothetical protein Ta2G_18520 [Termitinemataceae bacterium]|nr:MAG: hypothetical protein Ta2G_18520 [Termitinemataceae bacterium]